MSARATRWLLLVAAIALIVWSWQPGFTAPYQYDDYVTPVKDPASQSLTSFWHALPVTLRPLTKLTYALESSLGATSAPARRVLNAALFFSAGALLARLLRLAGTPWEFALLLATLWACHPVHAETIIALAGRSVLLALCLTLLSAVLLLQDRVAAALACALLALLARETALAWFVACAALSAWRRAYGARHIAFVLIAALTIGAGCVLSSPRLRELLGFSWGERGAWNRLGLQWAAVPHGIWLWLSEPAAFTLDMDFAATGWARLVGVLSAAVLYAAALWLAFAKHHGLSLRIAAALWLCLVLPAHSLVPKLDPLTARSISESSAALLLLPAHAIAPLLERSPIARTRLSIGLSIALALVLHVTRAKAALYRDSLALWRDAAARSEHGTRPLINLGTLLAQRGELRVARRTLAEAVRRDPRASEARQRLAAVDTLIQTKNLLTNGAERETVDMNENLYPEH